MIPRFAHRAYAALAGYFWIDCEHCGKGFGGHQWRDVAAQSRSTGPSSGTAAYCSRCAKVSKIVGRTLS